MQMRIMCIFLVIAMIGCASFQPRPGQRVSLPYSEQVLGSNLSVSVRVATGDDDRGISGFCDLPDASNTIDCFFHLSFLDNLPMARDGYRYLTYNMATEMCYDALWSIGINSGANYTRHGNQHIVYACARALMYHRFMSPQPEEYGPEERTQ